MDEFTKENKSLVSNELIQQFECTYINVYLDKELVYTGTINGFLEENQYQEDIVYYATETLEKGEYFTREISGDWYFNII